MYVFSILAIFRDCYEIYVAGFPAIVDKSIAAVSVDPCCLWYCLLTPLFTNVLATIDTGVPVACVPAVAGVPCCCWRTVTAIVGVSSVLTSLLFLTFLPFLTSLLFLTFLLFLTLFQFLFHRSCMASLLLLASLLLMVCSLLFPAPHSCFWRSICYWRLCSWCFFVAVPVTCSQKLKHEKRGQIPSILPSSPAFIIIQHWPSSIFWLI